MDLAEPARDRCVAGPDLQRARSIHRIVDAGEHVDRAEHRERGGQLDPRGPIERAEHVARQPQSAPHQEEIRARAECRILDAGAQRERPELLAKLRGEPDRVLDLLAARVLVGVRGIRQVIGGHTAQRAVLELDQIELVVPRAELGRRIEPERLAEHVVLEPAAQIGLEVVVARRCVCGRCGRVLEGIREIRAVDQLAERALPVVAATLVDRAEDLGDLVDLLVGTVEPGAGVRHRGHDLRPRIADPLATARDGRVDPIERPERRGRDVGEVRGSRRAQLVDPVERRTRLRQRALDPPRGQPAVGPEHALDHVTVDGLAPVGDHLVERLERVIDPRHRAIHRAQHAIGGGALDHVDQLLARLQRACRRGAIVCTAVDDLEVTVAQRRVRTAGDERVDRDLYGFLQAHIDPGEPSIDRDPGDVADPHASDHHRRADRQVRAIPELRERREPVADRLVGDPRAQPEDHDSERGDPDP